ncbi:MAG: hypothetical protein LBC64_11050 [Fibromonadaceae bacterium]|nr:hypothetical protein [Fibromonadaceae bacterium]
MSEANRLRREANGSSHVKHPPPLILFSRCSLRSIALKKNQRRQTAAKVSSEV